MNVVGEFERTLGAANIRLVEICGDKLPLEEHVLTFDAEKGVLRSGEREITHLDLRAEGGLKMAKKAIWCLVDSVKELVKPTKKAEKKAEKKEHKGARGIEGVLEAIKKFIATANSKLAEIVGRPDSVYSLDEVRMTTDSDCCGIYVHSGPTPVVSVARIGDPELAISAVKSAIFDMVDATRVAIERRAGIKADADALREESEKADKAERALKAAGADAALIERPDEAAKAAIVKAAKEAVALSNHNPFAGIVRQRDFRMAVKTFRFGVVIEAGRKPCLITRFPKVCNNATIEKMVKFVQDDVSALSASRASYFERVRQDMDRERRLRRAAELRMAADAQIMAVAAM